jgi:ABC-type sugar transport system ATPase subunit
MAFLQVINLLKQGAVKDISLEQKPLQKIAIAGETGSGKTTLLKLIAGLLQPDAGTILFNNEKVLGPDEKLLPGHPKIAFLSQYFELRNNYRVEEELEASNKISVAAANIIYDVCRINHLLKRKTTEVSGGERQRIVLAKLLTTSPQLLLLDEPFSNLDHHHRTIIRSVLDDIGSKLQVSCILVSHDAQDILPWADVVLLLKNGEIIQQGTPHDLYHKPVNEYCAGLLGDYNLIDAKEGQWAIIRPEKIILSKDMVGKWQGIVTSILFCGHYYTIEVSLAGKAIKVNTATAAFSIGEKVSLHFSNEDLSFVSVP